MYTIIHPASSRTPQSAKVPASEAAFRQPAYDCQKHRNAMRLVVYVPGVEASGVEIEGRGFDLTVTARKPRRVRVNWQALNLESAQRDYRLRLRLGAGVDYSAMQAEISHGILTVTLPKRATESPSALRRVA
jgi:HSP20 family protein